MQVVGVYIKVRGANNVGYIVREKRTEKDQALNLGAPLWLQISNVHITARLYMFSTNGEVEPHPVNAAVVNPPIFSL